MSVRRAGAHSIAEVAAVTGLPASTLRYYESIGIIDPVDRGATSGHRIYSDADLDQVTWLACLSATGLSVGDIRQYLANGRLGQAAAEEQIALLTAHEQRLAREADQLALRRRYVALKVTYWQAIAGGDGERADQLSAEASALAGELKRAR